MDTKSVDLLLYVQLSQGTGLLGTAENANVAETLFTNATRLVDLMLHDRRRSTILYFSTAICNPIVSCPPCGSL